jgi:hypothetical protein
MRTKSGPCEKCGTHRARLNRDHIVPTWKAKRLGWTDQQRNAPSNIQWLCANCHQDKSWSEQSEASRTRIAEDPEAHRARVRRNVVKAHEACRGKPSWNKGVPASEETRRRLSASHIGIAPPNKGKRGVSDETRERMRAAQKARREREAEIEMTTYTASA